MDGSRIFIDENVARLAMCEMLWNPCVGVVRANNTKVMHQGIWTWSCTLRGGLHAFELNLATNLVKASANFHPFHIHDWISRGISSRIFFPSQVRFEGRVNEKCLLELSRDCRQRERTGRTTRFIRKTVFHSGWDFWKISFRSFG